MSVTIGPPNWRKPVRSSRIRTLPKMKGYHVTIFNGSHYSVWSLQTYYVITLQREITRSNLHTKIHTLSSHTTAWDNKDGPTNQRHYSGSSFSSRIRRLRKIYFHPETQNLCCHTTAWDNRGGQNQPPTFLDHTALSRDGLSQKATDHSPYRHGAHVVLVQHNVGRCIGCTRTRTLASFFLFFFLRTAERAIKHCRSSGSITVRWK